MCSQWLGQKVPKGKTQAVSIPGLNLVICNFFILSHTDSKKTCISLPELKKRDQTSLKFYIVLLFTFFILLCPFMWKTIYS